MNKKNIIIVIIISILLILIGFITYNYITSSRSVIFTSSYSDTKIEFTDKNNKKTIVDLNQKTSLKIGSYTAIYTNKDLDQNTFTISILKNTSKIELNPGYNEVILNTKLKEQNSQIKQTIKSLFVSKNYSITSEKIYHQGEWFSGILRVYQIDTFSRAGSSNPDNHDDYYIVLKKDSSDNNWKLIGGPNLILTTVDNPSIPLYILNNINPSN